ncbi:MAG: glycoside hydrolase family 2 TIM barrel-domain containing protein, partial [Gemmatimonadota bacterium]|nr:glycoside hydrolase family 2 TIM barrel-domain containing protein [Gemmatimonadota bacterium]
GDHEGGYTSFSFPATEALVRGSNTLAVQVDNRRHLLKVPGDVGWFNYGGIYRPVRIEVRPEIHLADIHVRTKTVNPAAVLSVKVRVEGPASFLPGTATVRIDLLDREMGLPVASSSRSFYWTGQEELSTFELRINRKFARLWSPEDPYLYKLRTRLTFEEQQLDQTFTKIGIRTISVSGRDFLLNGEPCPVRGICYFPDFEKTGLTLDGKAFARDLANFRELGINAIRSHFLLERRMLDACDSLGLLVWHDIPVYWVRDYDRYTLMLAREIAREMAASDRNRPCMAVWSLGNENDMRDTDRTSFFTALRDEVKRCVPDAVISLASYLDNWANVEKYVDVMCVNIYPGWYNFLNHDPIMWHAKPEMLEKDIARFAGLFRKSIESNSPMPLWVGEIGGGAAFGMYKDDPWRLFSEDYQATLVKKQLELIESIPEISGLFLHRYNDYNDPSRMEVPGQNGRNLKGIVTIDGKRKKAFEVLKAFYRRWKR